MPANAQPPQPDRHQGGGNRLRHEASLYLRQHAQNPVDWFPWGDEALARARELDRPIFLSSGYSSCHWCHVMEHEVFEDAAVAAYLDEHFVSIKVDREELPAVDATYMEAVQLMTGRGGWPMTVFMTPDLEPFFGATYIPRDGFLDLLRKIVAVWRDQRTAVTDQAATVAERLRAEPVVKGPAPFDPSWHDEVVATAATRFDHEHGGQAGDMKFPTPVRWHYLLHLHRKTGNPTARRLVEATLDAMARGGLYDHVGGGFHRYTVDPHWTVPHFEKMLYDNAQLASLYLEAGVALRRDDYLDVGLDVLDFLDREMTGPEGAVYASLDADSGGQEGTYYAWTREELLAAVGPDDGPVLADLLGVDTRGNFESGRSVLTRRADTAHVARQHNRTEAEVSALWTRYRPVLRQVRGRRTPPTLDRKIITAWNGLALSAFSQGAMVSGRHDLFLRSQAILSYLESTHRGESGQLIRASDGGNTVGQAVLTDHVFLARGLLNHYFHTGSPRHLAWAQELLLRVRDGFVRDAGAWYTTAADDAQPLGRRIEVFDSVMPSGCAAMLDALLTLGALTGDAAAREAVARELTAHSALVRQAGLDMAGWLDAALRLEGPLHHAVVAGDECDTGFQDLKQAIQARLSPGVVVTPVPAAGASDELLDLVSTLGEKTAVDGSAAVHVCQHGSCHEPTSNPLQVNEFLLDGWFC